MSTLDRLADDLRAAGFNVMCPVPVPGGAPALMVGASVVEVHLPVLRLRGEFNEDFLAILAGRLAIDVADLIA